MEGERGPLTRWVRKRIGAMPDWPDGKNFERKGMRVQTENSVEVEGPQYKFVIRKGAVGSIRGWDSFAGYYRVEFNSADLTRSRLTGRYEKGRYRRRWEEVGKDQPSYTLAVFVNNLSAAS